jgi:hypothetical protein
MYYVKLTNPAIYGGGHGMATFRALAAHFINTINVCG